MATPISINDLCRLCFVYHPNTLCRQQDIDYAEYIIATRAVGLARHDTQESSNIDPNLTNTTAEGLAQASGPRPTATENFQDSTLTSGAGVSDDVSGISGFGFYDLTLGAGNPDQRITSNGPNPLLTPSVLTPAPPLVGDLLPAPQFTTDLSRLARPPLADQAQPAQDKSKTKKRKSGNNYPLPHASSRHEHEILQVGDRLVLQIVIQGLVIQEHVEVMGTFQGPDGRTMVFYNRHDNTTFPVRNDINNDLRHGRSFGMFGGLQALAQELARQYPHVTQLDLEFDFTRPYRHFYVYRNDVFQGSLDYYRESVCRARGWCQTDGTRSDRTSPTQPKSKRARK